MNDKVKKFAENTAERFDKDKTNYHFILITSETRYFQEYEEKFYKEKNEKQNFYAQLTKTQKEINLKNVRNIKKNDKTKSVKTKLKEYDNLKNLVKILLKRNFTYVSIVHEGFYEIHALSMKYCIPLLNHDDKDCYICRKDNRKSKLNFNFFGKIFPMWNKKEKNKEKFEKQGSKKDNRKVSLETPINNNGLNEV